MKKYTKHFPNCSKLLLFSAIAMLACSAAQAQNSRHLADTVSGDYGTIVRSYPNNDKAVSFFWQTNQPCLEVVDFTMPLTYYAPLPYDLNIKDMAVLDDILYFCGTTAGQYTSELAGQGIIGYMDLQLFTSNTLDINYIIVPPTTNMNKLVAYDDGGRTHVAAIGELQLVPYGNYSTSIYFIFNCDNFFQPSVNYDMIQLNYNERPWDVVLTDNLLVFFGYNADPAYNSLYFRRTDKYNVFSQVIDTVHYYDSVFDSYSRTHTIAADRDNIITSYLHIGSQPSTFIRTIDAATGEMLHSQKLDIPDKSEPIDLIYSVNDVKAVLMEDFYWGGQINSNFVYFNPYSNDTDSTDVEYRPGWLFKSMTKHEYKFYLAGIGSEWFYKSVNHTPTGSPDPSCPETSKIPIYPVDLLEHYEQPSPIAPWSDFDNMINISDVTTTSSSDTTCKDD